MIINGSRFNMVIILVHHLVNLYFMYCNDIQSIIGDSLIFMEV